MSTTTDPALHSLRVGFVGLGAMGAPMARRLASRGAGVVAFDPGPHAAAAVAGSGISLYENERAVAAASDILLCMVATAHQARAALLGEHGALSEMRRGGVVVVMATLGNQIVEELAAAAAAVGVGLVDAPVSGGTVRAGSGELLIMSASDDSSWQVVEPVLRALGDPVRRVGRKPGQGQMVKLVNQLLCGVHIATAAEALALAGRLGLDANEVWETIRHGAAASFMLGDRGERMVNRTFDDVRSALDIFVKDMNLVTEAAEAAGLDSVLAGTARRVFEEASASGWGRQDDSGVIRWYEPKTT